MIGISKKELEDMLRAEGRLDIKIALNFIIQQCHELDPWIPIDENTPKDDREILLFVPGCYGCEIGRWNINADSWSCYPYEPTHYQELPDDPEP